MLYIYIYIYIYIQMYLICLYLYMHECIIVDMLGKLHLRQKAPLAGDLAN
jgi:hypothetical protein